MHFCHWKTVWCCMVRGRERERKKYIQNTKVKKKRQNFKEKINKSTENICFWPFFILRHECNSHNSSNVFLFLFSMFSMEFMASFKFNDFAHECMCTVWVTKRQQNYINLSKKLEKHIDGKVLSLAQLCVGVCVRCCLPVCFVSQSKTKYTVK